MSNEELLRKCRTCGDWYQAGTYRKHGRTHPRQEPLIRPRVVELLAQGHTKASAARLLGVTPQRVSQVMKWEAA